MTGSAPASRAALQNPRWTMQYGVDDGEDRGVGADSEREREDRGGGERGGPSQHPERIPHVLQDALEARFPVGIANVVFDRGVAAVFQPGGAARLFQRHARLQLRFDRLVEVAADLLVEFLILPFTAE